LYSRAKIGDSWDGPWPTADEFYDLSYY